MSDELTLIDANILVYALFPESEHYLACRTLINAGASLEAGLCVTSQILAEFFSTVTNSKRVSQVRTPEDAADSGFFVASCIYTREDDWNR